MTDLGTPDTGHPPTGRDDALVAPGTARDDAEPFVSATRRGLLATPWRGLVAALGGAGVLAACDVTSSPFDRDVHLLRRLGYGPTVDELARLRTMGESAWVSEQFSPGSISQPALESTLAALPALTMSAVELDAASNGPNEAIQLGLQLKLAAVIRQVLSRAQLHERLVEFWSDHFNVPQSTANLSLLKIVEDREAVRPYALSSFSELLVESAQSPAMLLYLDNARSFAGAINENYARELLELHTVGRTGGYTEDDIVATAQLLTGWTIDTTTYEFRFRADRHDHSPLTIMGWTRPSGGDPLDHGVQFLQYLAMLPATAEFVCRKLTVRFVSDQPTASIVDAMADAWLANGSAIEPVIRTMIAHPDFDRSADTKFNRPLDYFVSALRAAGATMSATTSQPALVGIGRALVNLGQIPFDWAAPNGYPDVQPAWLDSGALLNRWNLIGDALGGQFSSILSFDLADLPQTLAGRLAPEVYDEIAERVRAEGVTGPGRVVLHQATGWSDQTAPTASELATAIPLVALTLLTTVDAQYR